MDTLINSLQREFVNSSNINRIYSQEEYICLKKTYTERIISAMNALDGYKHVIKRLLTLNQSGIAFLAKARKMLTDLPDLEIADIEIIYTNLIKLYTAYKKIHELNWGLNSCIDYQHSQLDPR